MTAENDPAPAEPTRRNILIGMAGLYWRKKFAAKLNLLIYPREKKTLLKKYCGLLLVMWPSWYVVL